MKNKILNFILGLGFAWAAVFLWAYGYLDLVFNNSGDDRLQTCSVNRVMDGDSVRLNCGKNQENLNIRLYCIDAPEMNQEPWGKMARDYLGAVLRGGTVQLEAIEVDRYGRTVGRLWLDTTDINRALVFAGVAAVYPEYCLEWRYYHDERQARWSKRGIWAERGLHQTPWEWRRL